MKGEQKVLIIDGHGKTLPPDKVVLAEKTFELAFEEDSGEDDLITERIKLCLY